MFYDDEVKNILKTAKKFANSDKDLYIRPSHILWTMLNDDSNVILMVFNELGVEIREFGKQLHNIRKENVTSNDTNQNITNSQELIACEAWMENSNQYLEK